MSRKNVASPQQPAQPASPNGPTDADEALGRLIETGESRMFKEVVAGKISAGHIGALTITATRFDLANEQGQRLATLGRNTAGLHGLALFAPGSEHARLELMLEADCPTIRFNDARGRQRLRLHLTEDETPSVVLLGPRGMRLLLAVMGDRPHVALFPRGSRTGHVVTGMPRGKVPAFDAAWRRIERTAKMNQRKAFDEAALDAGHLESEIPKLWNAVRRAVRARRRRITGSRVPAKNPK
jgi:hypothetical protein